MIKVIKLSTILFFIMIFSSIGYSQTVVVGAGGGAPGGANTNIQYNSAGSFAGDAGLTWSGSALSVTGTASSKILEVAGHAAIGLSAAQVSSTIIYNTGQAAANIQLTLPAAAAGYSFIATVGTTQAANTWKFTAAANDKIYLDGVAGTDNQSAIVTPAIGNFITCLTFKTDNYDWICKSGVGIWTAGP